MPRHHRRRNSFSVPRSWLACSQRSQTRIEVPRERIVDRLIRKTFDRVLEKSPDEKAFRLTLWNAARAQIEQRVLIERADRRAVPADHVVGEDYQLRLGISFGAGRKQQRLEELMRVRFDGAFAHQDPTLTDRAATPPNHAFEKLPAGRVG